MTNEKDKSSNENYPPDVLEFAGDTSEAEYADQTEEPQFSSGGTVMWAVIQKPCPATLLHRGVAAELPAGFRGAFILHPLDPGVILYKDRDAYVIDRDAFADATGFPRENLPGQDRKVDREMIVRLEFELKLYFLERLSTFKTLRRTILAKAVREGMLDQFFKEPEAQNASNDDLNRGGGAA